MEFEWDPGKARSNERKHAITFEFATGVFSEDRVAVSEQDQSGFAGVYEGA
jgi:uncharacterized DUF497 family protein